MAKKDQPLTAHRVKMLFVERRRLDMGLNQTEFCELVGITRQAYSNAKSRGTTSPATASKIAKVIGVPVKDILIRTRRKGSNARRQ